MKFFYILITSVIIFGLLGTLVARKSLNDEVQAQEYVVLNKMNVELKKLPSSEYDDYLNEATSDNVITYSEYYKLTELHDKAIMQHEKQLLGLVD